MAHDISIFATHSGIIIRSSLEKLLGKRAKLNSGIRRFRRVAKARGGSKANFKMDMALWKATQIQEAIFSISWFVKGASTKVPNFQIFVRHAHIYFKS